VPPAGPPPTSSAEGHRAARPPGVAPAALLGAADQAAAELQARLDEWVNTARTYGVGDPTRDIATLILALRLRPDVTTVDSLRGLAAAAIDRLSRTPQGGA
jgi:hypothetical protein